MAAEPWRREEVFLDDQKHFLYMEMEAGVSTVTLDTKRDMSYKCMTWACYVTNCSSLLSAAVMNTE